jgi:hypothetical protein
VDAIIAPAKKVYTETTAPVFEKYQPKLDTLKASIKAAEEELKRIGERQQKTMFDTKGNWRFENGAYIHIKHTTIAVTGPGFSLAKFKKKFGDLIEVNFKISELKKLFTDGDSRKQSGIEKYDIDLKPVKSFEVKMKAQTNDEQEN